MKRKLIKAVSLILCAVLVAAAIPAAAFADDGTLRFTVSSDTHFYSNEDAGTLADAAKDGQFTDGMLNSETYYHATFQGQMNHESKAIAISMLNDFVKSDSDYLLIPGDLTCGKRNSHLEFAELLKEAEKKSGKKIFVINGNHDCETEDLDKYIDIDEFKKIYADFGFNDATASDPNSASYAVDLSKDYRLLAVDSCIYGEDDGKISTETLNWVAEQAKIAQSEGKNVIVMMHHSLLPHFTVQPMIDNYAEIAEKIADMGIKLVFTGHIHANDISMANSKNGNTVYDIQTGSLITAPNAYRTVEITAEQIKIDSKYVTEIDTQYLPDGYSETQLQMIKSDFPSYASGYFEAGMCRWLNRYIGSAGKLGKTLKQTPGSFGYNLIDKIMKNIGEALILPIYDDGKTPDTVDSIEEIAALAGVELPESDYERVYQIAAKFMGGFYHGDESETMKTVEFPLFYACFKAVLVRTITNLTFTTYTAKIVNEIVGAVFGVKPYDKMLADGSKLINASEAVDTVLESVLYNVCDGLVEDLSEPADISITIDGYGTNNTAKKEVQLDTFKKIILFLKNFSLYIIEKI